MDAPTAPNPTGAATEHGTLALLITADGGIASVTLPPGTGDLGRATGELVGRPFDVVRLRKGLDMWIHDEGLYEFPEPNVTASRIAGVHGWDWHPYHGSVLLTGVDALGNTSGLDRTTAGLLTDLGFEAAHEGPLRPKEHDGHRARTYLDVLGRRSYL